MVDIKEGFQITSALSSTDSFAGSKKNKKKKAGGEKIKKAPAALLPNARAAAPSARPKSWSLGGSESWNQFGLLIPREAPIPALTSSNELKRL